MNKSHHWLLALPLTLTFAHGVAVAQPPASFQWQTATPDSRGGSSKKLDAIRGALAARKTKALLVIRNDAIIYEWYAAGHAGDKKHYAASLSKPVVGALAVALLLGDGRLK